MINQNSKEAAHVEYFKRHDVARRVNDALIAVLGGRPDDPVAVLGSTLLRPAHPPGQVQIYAFEGSANSMGVIAAAACMKIPYEFVRTDITRGDQHTDAFREINPKCKIPAIEVPDIDLRLGESNAILRCLANLYPVADHWYPANPISRAKVDFALDWRQTEFYPHLSSWAYYVMDYTHDKDAAVAGRKRTIAEFDGFLAKVVDRNGGFAGGPTVSIADIAIVVPLIFLRVRRCAHVLAEIFSLSPALAIFYVHVFFRPTPPHGRPTRPSSGRLLGSHIMTRSGPQLPLVSRRSSRLSLDSRM